MRKYITNYFFRLKVKCVSLSIILFFLSTFNYATNYLVSNAPNNAANGVYTPNGTQSGGPKYIHTNGNWQLVFDGMWWHIYDGETNYASEMITSGYTSPDNASWSNSITITATEMPVELISFTATFIVQGIQLNWETATEVNNYGFELQRQIVETEYIPSEKWEAIGFIEGHGNSNSPKQYEFIDKDAPEGKLEYRLKQIDIDGGSEYYSLKVSIENTVTDIEKGNELPTEYVLQQNYPNPFNPNTIIQYNIPRHSVSVQLKIYDVLGSEIKSLVDKSQPVGTYKINFYATDLPSGIYFYTLSAGQFTQTKKMLLLK